MAAGDAYVAGHRVSSDGVQYTKSDSTTANGVAISTPSALALGLMAQITPYGTLRVSAEPGALLNETYETTLDPLKWTASGTVPPTAAVGALALNGGTTNSATSILTSVATFQPTAGFTLCGATILFDAAKVANCNQNMTYGFAACAAPTSAAPVDNGYVFERDTGGDINCCVFVSGVKYVINSTSLAKITSSATIQAAFPGAIASALAGTGVAMAWPGGNHTLLIAQRGDLCFWYLDSFDVPIAYTKYIAPAAQVLPYRIAKINAAASVVAVINTFSATLVADSASQNSTVSDPIYPWRRQAITLDGASNSNVGGALTVAVAAAGSANVKTTPGRLGRIVVTVAGTASLTIYDNASGNSTGTIIGITPAVTSVGQVLDFNIPAALGISAVGGAGSPGVTIGYN